MKMDMVVYIDAERHLPVDGEGSCPLISRFPPDAVGESSSGDGQ